MWAYLLLTELLNLRSVETRYGAFQALQARSPTRSIYESTVRPGDFYFHIVPSSSFPVIHFSKSKKPELTLIGEDQTVSDNFLIVEPGLTMRSLGDGTVKITRFTRRDGNPSFTCSNQVSDIVKSMVDLDMDYGAVLDLFQKAKSANMLNSKLVIDARPKPRRKSDEKPEAEASRFVAGPIPQMFRGARETGKEDGLAQPVYFEEVPAKKKNFFAKMTGWWK